MFSGQLPFLGSKLAHRIDPRSIAPKRFVIHAIPKQITVGGGQRIKIGTFQARAIFDFLHDQYCGENPGRTLRATLLGCSL